MMKDKRWILRKDYEIEIVERLAKELGVDTIIATLLVERGITTFEEAKQFFRPSLEQLHDPFIMKDMDRAVVRISNAIRNRERILVYGDYDVDGTSAVALVYSYLHSLYENLDFYVPDRESEGYGISFQGIDYASETGVKLIIALDCGIKAIEQVDYATTKGIDFIIADHHLPGETIPHAIAVLDPKRHDCSYPYKDLSGCGLGFKIVEALLEKRHGVRLCDPQTTLSPETQHRQDLLKRELLPYLDLVAISIASDIVPITGENRVLAAFGLKVLNKKPRPGIEAILKFGHIGKKDSSKNESGSDNSNYFCKEITISDLVFSVGPRINAAGRIRSAFDSVRLLIAVDSNVAEALAKDIDEYNSERKNFDSAATDTAKSVIEHNQDILAQKAIVLYNPTWHRGVVGIVASRLVEAYYKPTIILTKSTDNIITGSARSIKEFDIHAALEKCSDLLEHFGGHKCAAGVSLKLENLERFTKKFESIVQEELKGDDMVPEIEIDSTLVFSEHITPKFLRILKQFAPFGPGNNTPVFLSQRLVDTGYARVVGGKHLKFAATQIDVRSDFYSAIGFQLGSHCDKIRRSGTCFDICYTLEENHWNGKTEIQLNVKDIRFHE